MADWLLWKVLLPFLLLVLMWPIYAYICHIDGAFLHAFEHGDLLILSALILIEIALEIKHADSVHHGTYTDMWQELARLCALLLIFVFGFIKYDVIKRYAPAAGAEHDADNIAILWEYAMFAFCVSLFVVSIGFLTFWRSQTATVASRVAKAREPH